MADKEITLGVGDLGIGTDISTFSLYHTSVTGSNLIQSSIPKEDIIGGTAKYNVDESYFTFIVVDDKFQGRQTINLPGPSISSFSPTSGGTGSTVSLVGSDFAGVTEVRFGGILASSFVKNSNTSITATVGTGTTGKITVTGPGGTATSLTNFNYSSGGGDITYYLGRFGYSNLSYSTLCSSPNLFSFYDLYCANYNSLSAATAASAPVFTNSDLSGTPPLGYYVIRTDSTPPTGDDTGFYYLISSGIPTTKGTCEGFPEVA